VIEYLHDRYGDSFDDLVLTMLAIALIVVGTIVLARSLVMSRVAGKERESFTLERRHKVAAVAIGATTGFVIGLTSAGSGTLIAVFLIVLYRMTPKTVVGTDVFHAAILLWAAGLAHVIGGNVDFALVGSILIGSIPGVWIGSHLTARIPSGVLRVALGIVLIASSLALFNKAEVDVPVFVIASIPSLLVIALLVQYLVRRSRLLALEGAAPPSGGSGL
jgi:uncharacterized protein